MYVINLKNDNLLINENKVTMITGNSFILENIIIKELISKHFFVKKSTSINDDISIEEVLIKNHVDIKSNKFINLISKFRIKSFIDSNSKYLSIEEKSLITLLITLYHAKQRIILNEFDYFTDNIKNRLIKYVKDNNITLIIISNDIENALLTDYILVYQNNKIMAYDEKEVVLANEKLLKDVIGKLPFVVELSIQLKYYKAVTKTYFDSKELVGDLWT